MDNIQSTLHNYTLNFKFSLQLYLYHKSQCIFHLNEVPWDIIVAQTQTIYFELKIVYDVMYHPYSVYVVQIHIEFQIFIDIVSIWFLSMKIHQILVQLQLKPLSSNWKLNTMWCMDNIQYTFYKYNLSLKFSLIVYLNHSFQWRFFGYYCSSNSNHLVKIENWTRWDVWTIFSPRCTNTLWISNFHWYCIYMIPLNEDLSDISPAPTQTT